MKIFPLRALATAMLLAGAFMESVPAAVIALYEFPSAAGTALPSASTDTDPNSTAGVLSLGAGYNNSGISSTAGNPVNSLFIRPADNSTEAFAVGGNRYFTFTLTPVSGSLNYDSLVFDYRRDSVDSAESFAVYTSVGGFTAGNSIASGTLTNVSVGSFTTGFTVPLSGVPSLQNVAGAVSFRMYVWGAATQTDVTRFDNITVNASVVPEPATATLVAGGLALLGLIAGRRKSCLQAPLRDS